jgi:hypothetical protein
MEHRIILLALMIVVLFSGWVLGNSNGRQNVLAGPAVATPLGSAFTYQGRLTDNGGLPTGNYDMQFTLFDQAASGSQIAGPVTIGDVPVSGGLFTVQIDFGSAVFDGDNRFLAIGIRPGSSTGAFTPLGTRQQMTATPYALYALNAATATALLTPPPRRKFYMTSAFFAGNAAITSCVAGYHMASFQEIIDPSNLEYATDLVGTQAHTLADAGSGPPFSSLAFVRTGVSDASSGNVVPGNANCNVWTTNSTSEFGTVIALKPTWTDSPNNISPWDANVKRCDNIQESGTGNAVLSRAHLWCVQD